MAANRPAEPVWHEYQVSPLARAASAFQRGAGAIAVACGVLAALAILVGIAAEEADFVGPGLQNDLNTWLLAVLAGCGAGGLLAVVLHLFTHVAVPHGTVRALARVSEQGLDPYVVPAPSQWTVLHEESKAGHRLEQVCYLLVAMGAVLAPIMLGFIVVDFTIYAVYGLIVSLVMAGLALLAIRWIRSVVRPGIERVAAMVRRSWPEERYEQIVERAEAAAVAPRTGTSLVPDRNHAIVIGQRMSGIGGVLVGILLTILPLTLRIRKPSRLADARTYSEPVEVILRNAFVAEAVIGVAAVVLVVVGAIIASSARLHERRALRNAAGDPEAARPPEQVLLRHTHLTFVPLSLLLIGLGSVATITSMAARHAASTGAETFFGAEGVTVAGLAGGLALIAAGGVAEVFRSESARTARNVVLARWPVPVPRTGLANGSGAEEAPGPDSR
ncbi:hypothetical protein [Ruania alba]|uniref:Uncharacterized protein n=1 Tax=Ruania alba TaxID=648782 RepID=A0A1H5M0K1_9MICO|nr:hypothetical protein [Ruania alba]SEE82058.1 hypothetical protein SAMN04488554_3050 [Ruania alba]